MIDSLDRQILEIIEKAPTIVRSITEREIESGVLFPSVSTLDIKKHLPADVNVEVIEGRLNALESGGYIYFENKRWWLTNRGRVILGRVEENTVLPTPPSRPMRTILEETFSRFEASTGEPLKPSKPQHAFTEFMTRQSEAEALLAELEKGLDTGLISEDEYSVMAESVQTKLKKLNLQTETYVKSKRSQLMREITALEEALAKKKAELERLNRIQAGK